MDDLGSTALDWAIMGEHYDAACLLLKFANAEKAVNRCRWDDLMVASCAGDAERVKDLLSKGVESERPGYLWRTHAVDDCRRYR